MVATSKGHYTSTGDGSSLQWVGESKSEEMGSKSLELKDKIESAMQSLRYLPLDDNASYFLDELELLHMELFEALYSVKE